MYRLPRFLVVCSFLLPAIAFTQPTISGIVRNGTNGNPVGAADLDAFDALGNVVAISGGTTLADGTYTITLPAAGTYYLRVDLPNGSPLVDQYYGGSLLKSQATPIQVPSDTSQITGIDFSLPPGFAITGRVTGNGTSPGVIDLDLYAGNEEFLGNYPAATAADGTFLIGALPNGTYYLKADPDPVLGQYWVFRFYGGSLDQAQAQPIVINGGSVSGINWDLPPGGVISGQMLDANAAPLADIDLDVFDTLGNRLPYNGKSDLDGTYAVGPMPAGDYHLRADPKPEQGFVRTYYGNGIDPDLAVAIPVSLNQTTSSIDFVLQAGGTITGTVTGPGGGPLSGIDLDIFDSAGLRVDLTARTGADGTYLLGAMPTGNYRVRADPVFDSGLAGRYYGGNSAPSSAVLIPVNAGAATSGINISLETGGWITGTIRDESGSAVPGIDLDVFDMTGVRLYPTDSTDANGQYAIGPLPVANVLLRADPGPLSGYAHQYYPTGDFLVEASPLAVPPSAGLQGIDFTLPPAGWIAGTIRDEMGVPLPGIDLDLFDAAADDRLFGGGTSGPDGTYLIGPLKFGSYHLRADPTPAQPYVRSYYFNAVTINSALSINVLSTSGNPGIDFSLVPGRSLSGQVLLPDLQPAAGIDLDIISVDTGKRLEQTTTTDAGGHFVFPPIRHGTFLLRADPIDTSPYLDTYFGNTAFKDTATAILVDATASLEGLDITLLPYQFPTISQSPETGPYLILQDAGGLLDFNVLAPSGEVVEFRLYLNGYLEYVLTGPDFSIQTSQLPKGSYVLVPAVIDIFSRETRGDPVLIVNSATPPSFSQPLFSFLPNGAGQTILLWQGESGITYRIEFAPSPAGPWQLVREVTGSGTMISQLDPLPVDDARYLHVIRLN